MKRLAWLGLWVSATGALCGCGSTGGGDATAQQGDALQCAAGQTALYSKAAPPSAGENGASGIGEAASVLSGGSGSGSGTSSTAAGGAPAPSPPSAPSTPSTPTPDKPFASTTASCVAALCPRGQVAVPRVGSGGGTGETGISPPSEGVAAPSGIASSGAAGSSPSGTPLPSPPASPSEPSTPVYTASEVLCVSAPPACPSGQAPSYAPAGFWHCLPLCDANNQALVVISYGGEFGNGGVCAGPPPQQACPVASQVWTWDYTHEAWSCQAECNNGSYDQRSFQGRTVCVPC